MILALGVGVAAYLVYIVQHGSDQMAPRFFSTLTVNAAFVIAWSVTTSRLPAVLSTRGWAAVGFGMLLLGNLTSPLVPLKSLSPEWGADAKRNSRVGVDDHRAVERRGRLTLHDQSAHLFARSPAPEWEVRMGMAIGLDSFQRGPQSHTLDIYALADPLLSRLPAANGPWRPGYVERIIPAGYVESLYLDENRIEDPSLHRYYDVVRLIRRGSLWSWDRFVALP